MASRIERAIRSTVGSGIGLLASANRRRLSGPDGGHPFVTGIHRPMAEEVTLEDLPVTGSIPPELEGSYLRNGPNPVPGADLAGHHWFIGAGMIHGIRIGQGRAHWYRNRWVRGREACDWLGETPPGGRTSGRLDAPNTNVVKLGGRIYAIVEAGGLPVALDDHLNTIGPDRFGGTLAGPFTAHPHRCPRTGEHHAICYQGDSLDTVWHTLLDADGRVVREEPIAVSHGPSIHDCAITDRHVIVFDLPVTLSMKRLMAGYRFPYAWNPDHPARVGLLRRDAPGSTIEWHAVDPCYVFHPANAHVAADGSTVVDLVAHETMFATSALGPDSEASRLERWTIRPGATTVERQVLHDMPQEFPRYDERRTGQPCRHVVTTALPAGIDNPVWDASRLFRHDLEAGTTEVHDFGEGRVPGEFVFVPAAAEGAETQGWYVGLVIDRVQETTDLAILDAADFGAPPVARIHLPHRIPPGFHGNWIAA